MLQGLLKSKAFASASGALMAAYIRFVKRTSTVISDPADFIQKINSDHPLIIAMWHGQGLLLPFLHTRKDMKVSVVVAKYIDGDIVHETLDRFGLTTIRGAGARRGGKDKGGVAALRACVKALRNDTTVALTADIPPGPARQAGLGLVTLAKLTGCVIVPCAVVTNRYFKLKTWSGFTVNLPFSNMVMTGGDNIEVSRRANDAELEAARQALEYGLNEVTARAYALSGTTERGGPADGATAEYGTLLRVYCLATRLLQPAAPLLLKYRERQGKEETGRTNERLGIPSAPRGPGPLAWIHASSVGETIAILHLIARLEKQRPDLQLLLTTGTQTSAKLALNRLPEGVIHQYIPLDAPEFMKRFFDHWNPSLAILTESEIWPNLIQQARDRHIPLALVNGRISRYSYHRWQRRMNIARPLFSSLDLVLAQNNRYAGYFERLGARNVQVVGNLKMDAPPPPADQAAVQSLKKAIGTRSLFLAASTHKGEEEIIANVHRTLKRDLPDLLTIIVPRHPDRGPEICDMLRANGFNCIRRTRLNAPAAEHDIYVADTIGELGLFYALSPVAFIGGSLVPHGGQNPFEAIMHDTAVLTGPNVHNFEEDYAALLKANACIEAGTMEVLAAKAHALLKDETERRKLVARAQAAMGEMGGALDATLDALETYLPPEKEQRRAS